MLDSGKVIGNIYCGSRDYEAREVGYIVNKLYQCRGYASEALIAVIEDSEDKKLYLYDILDIKKETSNPIEP